MLKTVHKSLFVNKYSLLIVSFGKLFCRQYQVCQNMPIMILTSVHCWVYRQLFSFFELCRKCLLQHLSMNVLYEWREGWSIVGIMWLMNHRNHFTLHVFCVPYSKSLKRKTKDYYIVEERFEPCFHSVIRMCSQ